jgi:hypothetical protein
MSHKSPLVSLASLVVLLGACQGTGEGSRPASVQQAVEDVAHQYRDVVRLTVHAVPRGETQLRAVASTSADKKGQLSDPEDRRAFQGGEEVVLEEGDALDVTLPMTDASGRRTWVAGVTIKSQGRPREQVVAEARTIAQALAAAVRGVNPPLW